MRSGLVTRPSHRSVTAIVFVTVLVASFFALAPTALACQSELLFEKIELGAAAPNDVYTIVVTDQDGRSQEVEVAAGATASLIVPPGTYSFVELDAPAGATIEPESVVVTVEDDQQTMRVLVTNPYLAGRLAIEKIESGDTAPGATYTFDVVGPDESTFSVDVAAGTTWTSDWLPLGTYTVTERDAPDGHTITPNPVVLAEDGATVTVTATNPYRDFHGRLAITKIESGDTAPGATYTFDVVGPDESTFSVDVAAGTTWTSDWLPLGTYTVTERDAPDGHTITPNPVVLTEDGATVTVTATNPYRDFHGRLAIEKVVTTNVVGEHPVGPFTFDVVGPDEVTFTVDVTAGETWTSDWLPLGSYTITERDAPSGHTITPNPAVLTEDGATVTVTATNPYLVDERARLAIEKIVTGSMAPAGATFVLDVIGPVAFTVELVAGETWTSDWLPLGSYTITERDAPSGHTITPNPAVLTEDGATVTVTATNPYRDFHGRLAITKIESGDTAPGATYTFDVVGPDESTFGVDVAAGTTWTSDWLPLGTYTVTERDAPDGHTLTPNPVVLTEDGATVTVTATNPYRDFHGRLAITKIVAGAPTSAATFTIRVTGPETFSITLVAGTTWTSDWLPLGTYTVTEVDAPAGATIVPNPVVLDTDGATATVTVTNPSVLVSATTLPTTGGGFGLLPRLAAAMLIGGAVLLVVGRPPRRA